MARHLDRSRKGRRARRLATTSALALAVIALVVVVVVTQSSGRGERPGAGTNSTGTTGTTGTTSTTSAPPAPTGDGTFGVGLTSLTVQDPANGASLPTDIWYPTTALSQAGRRAPYPLIVFSQGYGLSVQAYRSLLADWASAGFIVAAPTYPRTDPTDPAGLDENDIVNHPEELSLVITAVEQAGRQAGSALSGLVNPSEVGLAGHSDGGDVSLAVADNSCCRDGRVKALAVLSGAELSAFGGQYYAQPGPPLLVVQGDADTINPPGCSTQTYTAAGSPKYYLDLLGAGHEPPYTQSGPLLSMVAQVTTDFFDAELGGQMSGLAAMASAGSVPATAEFTAGGQAPTANPSCPGAP
jgi:dienelactone hydrolase